MRVILASQPEGKEKVISQLEKWLEKSRDSIKIGIINEAANRSTQDCHWLLTAFGRMAESFSGTLYMFNLLALDVQEVSERIADCEVIWCLGGNTNDLQIVFEKTEFVTLLPEVLKGKIWVGSSAGACILGKNYLDYFDFELTPHQNESYFKDGTYFLTDSAALVIEDNEIKLLENVH